MGIIRYLPVAVYSNTGFEEKRNTNYNSSMDSGFDFKAHLTEAT